MPVSVRTIHSVKLFESRVTVPLLDFPFQTQLAIAVPHYHSELRFQAHKPSRAVHI
jgi:hypothetical protein